MTGPRKRSGVPFSTKAKGTPSDLQLASVDQSNHKTPPQQRQVTPADPTELRLALFKNGYKPVPVLSADAGVPKAGNGDPRPDHPDIFVGEIRSTGFENPAWLICLNGRWLYVTTRELHAGLHTGRMAKFCTEKLGIWPRRISSARWCEIVNDRLSHRHDEQATP